MIMVDLRKYFEENEANQIEKWDHYFEVYREVFKDFLDRPIVLLEIGVNHGGSLEMWRNFFHQDSKIYGIDINPECKIFEKENVEIFIGSQSDRKFLNQLISSIPKFDIVIDDGGHTMLQQITSFQCLFGHLNDRGVYICEDVNTSYWPRWGGGVNISSTFVEFAKEKIDSINAWYSKEPNFKIDEYSRSIKSISFYSGVVVFCKGIVEVPVSRVSGVPMLKEEVNTCDLEKLTFRDRLKRYLVRLINRML